MLLFRFLLAMVPILWLILALSGLKMSSHKACLAALALACLLSIFFWSFSPLNMVTAILEGVLNALWPICLVITAALFTYNITVKTGAMNQINGMLAGVSSDQRVMMLLIGWGFGNFMEGMAGFGTSVAIPASMLASMGFHPISAAVACLVGTSMQTPFGSVGIATTTLAAVTGLDSLSLSGDVANLQWILTFMAPYIMICIMGGGIRALKGVMTITTIAALSFTAPYYLAGTFLGAELPGIIGSICTMVCIIAASRMLPQVRTSRPYDAENTGKTDFERKDVLKAWSPYLLIFLLLMVTSKLCPPVYDAVSSIKTSLTVYAGDNPGTLTFSWVGTPGVMIFLAGSAGGMIQGLSPAELCSVLLETLKKYWKTMVTICSIMAAAKIMSYSGMISDIASLLIAAGGTFYPILAPMLGVLGGFVTGSGTTTSVLFGGLQIQTASSLGLSPSWIAAANVVGAGIGKMLCPQSIAIAAGAIGVMGSESEILRTAFKYVFIYALLAGVVCLAGTF